MVPEGAGAPSGFSFAIRYQKGVQEGQSPLGKSPLEHKVIARSGATKQTPRIIRLLRGACSERHEILRYAQNDTKRRAQNDN